MKTRITVEDYIKINKALSRKEELEKNGGRWIAKDRPHRNKKKYNRRLFKAENKKYFED